MNHQPCDCIQQTRTCPRYGWMKGRKWEICRGINISPQDRDILLETFLRQREGANKNPSLIQKAANLASATVQHAVQGFVKASEELKAQRLAACESCELLNKEKRSCTHLACGCAVDIKAGWASEHCPMAKWPGDTEVLENKRLSLPCIPCGH